MNVLEAYQEVTKKIQEEGLELDTVMQIVQSQIDELEQSNQNLTQTDLDQAMGSWFDLATLLETDSYKTKNNIELQNQIIKLMDVLYDKHDATLISPLPDAIFQRMNDDDLMLYRKAMYQRKSARKLEQMKNDVIDSLKKLDSAKRIATAYEANKFGPYMYAASLLELRARPISNLGLHPLILAAENDEASIPKARLKSDLISKSNIQITDEKKLVLINTPNFISMSMLIYIFVEMKSLEKNDNFNTSDFDRLEEYRQNRPRHSKHDIHNADIHKAIMSVVKKDKDLSYYYDDLTRFFNLLDSNHTLSDDDLKKDKGFHFPLDIHEMMEIAIRKNHVSAIDYLLKKLNAQNQESGEAHHKEIQKIYHLFADERLSSMITPQMIECCYNNHFEFPEDIRKELLVACIWRKNISLCVYLLSKDEYLTEFNTSKMLGYVIKEYPSLASAILAVPGVEIVEPVFLFQAALYNGDSDIVKLLHERGIRLTDQEIISLFNFEIQFKSGSFNPSIESVEDYLVKKISLYYYSIEDLIRQYHCASILGFPKLQELLYTKIYEKIAHSKTNKMFLGPHSEAPYLKIFYLRLNKNNPDDQKLFERILNNIFHEDKEEGVRILNGFYYSLLKYGLESDSAQESLALLKKIGPSIPEDIQIQVNQTLLAEMNVQDILKKIRDEWVTLPYFFSEKGMINYLSSACAGDTHSGTFVTAYQILKKQAQDSYLSMSNIYQAALMTYVFNPKPAADFNPSNTQYSYVSTSHNKRRKVSQEPTPISPLENDFDKFIQFKLYENLFPSLDPQARERMISELLEVHDSSEKNKILKKYNVPLNSQTISLIEENDIHSPLSASKIAHIDTIVSELLASPLCDQPFITLIHDQQKRFIDQCSHRSSPK